MTLRNCESNGARVLLGDRDSTSRVLPLDMIDVAKVLLPAHTTDICLLSIK